MKVYFTEYTEGPCLTLILVPDKTALSKNHTKQVLFFYIKAKMWKNNFQIGNITFFF